MKSLIMMMNIRMAFDDAGWIRLPWHAAETENYCPPVVGVSSGIILQPVSSEGGKVLRAGFGGALHAAQRFRKVLPYLPTATKQKRKKITQSDSILSIVLRSFRFIATYQQQHTSAGLSIVCMLCG